jgi:hypothetical protein
MRTALALEARLLLASALFVAESGDGTGAGYRHLLRAVRQALDSPPGRRRLGRLQHASPLEQHARIVCASLDRLIASPHSDELDYSSEGDHILHQIADLPRAK